jgi:hypothetical protein
VNQIARVISAIFHPLLLATYWIALLAWVMPIGLDPIPRESHLAFILRIFLITFCIPTLALGALKAIGIIPTVTMVSRKERPGPFIFLTCWYFFVSYMLYSTFRVNLHDSILKFMIIMNALILVSTIVTFFYKVSIHSLGMWGLVGMLLCLNIMQEDGTLLYPLMGAIVLTGVVMSARLQLNVHTMKEIVLGSVLGLVISITGVIILF